MQAVILAAGKGSRMYPLATDKPKPLVEVANKPVLEHNLDQMLGLVDEVILVVGYKKDMIMEKFGDNYLGIKIIYVVQEEQLGTGHALLQTEKKIRGSFLVMNGDDLFSRKDMESISKYENCLLVKKEKDASSFAAVVVEQGLVVDIVEKPKEYISDLVNVGMYFFNVEVFEILKSLKKSERGEYEIPDAVRELAKLGKMHYEEVKGFWIPVGCPWHILEATEEMLEDNPGISIKGRLEEGVVVEGSVDIGEETVVGKGTLLKGNIVIGKNCQIGENCTITGFTAIGDNSVVKQGTTLDNVVVGKKSRLGERCLVRDSVLGEGTILSEGVKIESKSQEAEEREIGAFVGDGCKVDKDLKSGEYVSKKD
ncbi:MAG: bifunctional sugar-1-phosphate nucleotidylyltransferase/acetyltransferase [Candidatus Woesearchaeota archaeon]